MTLAEAKTRAGSVKPTFPVPGGIVTAGYWQPRPLSQPPEKRKLFHRAWDIYDMVGNSPGGGGPILAEETGVVSFWCAHRSWSEFYDAKALTPDGRPWFLNHRFHDAYGNMVILWGESDFLYVHAHIDDHNFWPIAAQIIKKCGGKEPTWVRRGPTYDRYVMYTEPNCMYGVLKGDVIGRVGQMGYSTAPHLHLDVFRSDVVAGRIDPGLLWPGRFAEVAPAGAQEEG